MTDKAALKDLEHRGAGRSFDELIDVETDYDEESALNYAAILEGILRSQEESLKVREGK